MLSYDTKAVTQRTNTNTTRQTNRVPGKQQPRKTYIPIIKMQRGIQETDGREDGHRREIVEAQGDLQGDSQAKEEEGRLG
jgi:hypothetical protein